MNSQTVQLLVSIRHRDEILPALQGGCDILDLKEPFNGPLAMVSEEMLRMISEFISNHKVTVPLSMALGELVEWQEKSSSLFIPKEISYLKMGLSQTVGRKNWYADWLDLRTQVEDINSTTFQWIAVAYADWQQAHSVSPQEVLTAAISSQCTGLLIDTYSKRGQSLLDFLSLEQIGALIEQARAHKLTIALAGSIHHENLASLSDVSPDIIGIRSAACRGNLRTNKVEEEAVRSFRKQLDCQYALTESG
ncbi:(5-formylfuran-3-yl)methyl phosphate synthase [uncultured Gimesia sp.]|uniref:(5-formylfuran-3-yl)methyl phosphate synthase n=1 Tax=uncultured Gimesia sp. TaxID=1678688 RepID=UPI00260A203F|nr:(5-formylfuran-3-yl)methyl phosphate synthase [uncultured Gimesia sp.]